MKTKNGDRRAYFGFAGVGQDVLVELGCDADDLFVPKPFILSYDKCFGVRGLNGV